MKFNFKNYKKINGDDHIDMRLQEQHGDIPNEINEKQLEKYRSEEPTELIQKQLEKKRTGEATEVVEKRMDAGKGKFGIPHRNKEAFEGDINKLEEKRLANDPVEEEAYEEMNEMPKAFRWWENVKSPDGLKIAKKNKIDKMAQVAEAIDEENIEELGEPSPELRKMLRTIPEEKDKAVYDDKDDFKITDVTKEVAYNPLAMRMIKYRTLPNKDPSLSGLYASFEYDVEQFGGDIDKIKQAALDDFLNSYPEMEGLISTDDLYDVRENGATGTVSLRAIGEEFAPFMSVENKEEEPESLGKKRNIMEEIGQETIESPKTPEILEEINYEEKDIGGTKMAVGKIKINADIEEGDTDLLDDIVLFIEIEHPNIIVEKESLDISNLANKEVSFVGSVIEDFYNKEMKFEPRKKELTEEEDFEIQEGNEMSQEDSQLMGGEEFPVEDKEQEV